MSKRPPEDNPIIEQILEQLEAKLGSENEDEVNEAIKAAMREAMQIWYPDIGSEDVSMSVVAGGKSDTEDSEEDSVEHDRSHLQIVEDENELLKEMDELFPNLKVRVLSPIDLLSGQGTLLGMPPDMLGPFTSRPDEKATDAHKPLKHMGNHLKGLISTEPGETQQLVHRQKISTYRVTCTLGHCTVETDQGSYTLSTGQSLDLDCAEMRVEAIERLEGWFQCIQEP